VRTYELKLAWADRQAQALESQIRAWQQAGGYGFVFEPQPGRREQLIRLKVDEIPPSLPLLIGDTLFALRSALDHLAYDLACSHTWPLPREAAEGSEFPVFWDRPMKAHERDRKIGAVHPDAAAVIEALQPHHMGDRYAEHPLWKLHELARIDRHRFLHVAIAEFGDVEVGGVNVHVDVLHMDFSERETLGDNAELGYVSARPIDLGQPMHMHLAAVPEIAFKEGEFAGQKVFGVFDEIKDFISREVTPQLTKYLK